MKIKNLSLKSFRNQYRRSGGLIFTVVSGDIQEWATMISRALYEEGITSTPDPLVLWAKAITVNTPEGRTFFAFVWNKDYSSEFEVEIWDLRQENCSWIPTFFENYNYYHKRASW